MPEYFYVAKSLKGEEKTGKLNVKDIHQLMKMLKKDGFILIKAELVGQATERKFSFSLPFFKIPLKEKMFFTRNLQVMVSAGFSLPKAIRVLALQVKNNKFKKILLHIGEEIIKGRSFSESLAEYPDVFSEFFQNMIKIGEEGGTLEKSLKNITLHLEKENSLRSRVTGAMIYPAVIIVAMIGVGILMLVKLVPQLAKTFEDLKIELPLTTRVIIFLGDFMLKNWYFVVIFFIVLFFLFQWISKTKEGKKIIDKTLLNTPLISPLVRETNSAYAIRSLSSLISAGISLPRSLEIAARALGNTYYKESLMTAAQKVRKGERLSDILNNYKDIYPVTVVQMIKVGEETGATSRVLAQLADFYDEEVSNITKNLTSIIEPILMIIIGAAVGFFAISVFQPIYSMLGSL